MLRAPLRRSIVSTYFSSRTFLPPVAFARIHPHVMHCWTNIAQSRPSLSGARPHLMSAAVAVSTPLSRLSAWTLAASLIVTELIEGVPWDSTARGGTLPSGAHKYLRHCRLRMDDLLGPPIYLVVLPVRQSAAQTAWHLVRSAISLICGTRSGSGPALCATRVSVCVSLCHV